MAKKVAAKTAVAWKFVFLLHNLELKEAFESKFMAIVPNDDARIKKIVRRTPAVAPLLRNFTDQHGKSRRPCALIVREDAPSNIGSLEAVISFRNIFALACLLYAWPRTIGSLNVIFPLWSDFFDFYPTTLMRDPQFLHTLSPATDGGCLPDNFRGQVSPNLPNPSHFKFQPDDRILSLLLGVWKKEFGEANSPDRKRRVLFRSLEMAYQAASIPSNSRYTIYDFGSRIALWVSAFEVLIHPGRKRPGKRKEGANIEKVAALLRQAFWQDTRLRRRRYLVAVERNKPKERANLILKLYRELYDARNDFLHGNPVVHSRLFCFCNEQSRSLIEIAPLIYKVALSCCFGQFGNVSGKSNEGPNYKEFFDRRTLEKALLASLENRK